MAIITRRSALAGAAAVATLSGAGESRAKSPAATRQAPGFYRYKVGDIEITAVNDGVSRMPIDDGFVRNASKAEVNAALRQRCIGDLSNGGRGIGNQLEAWLVNPLARALFDQNFSAGSSLSISSLKQVAGVPTAELKPVSA